MHVKTAANISFPKFIGRRFFDKFSVTSYFLHVNAKCFDNFLWFKQYLFNITYIVTYNTI